MTAENRLQTLNSPEFRLLVYSQDKKRLLEHFEKDRALFAYHIGDLDDFYFPHCQWIVDYGDKPRIREAILVYTGLQFPSVLTFGLTDTFESLLGEALALLPKSFLCHFFARYRGLFLESYDEQPIGTHLKMKLGEFRPASGSDNPGIRRLDPVAYQTALELYDRSYPGNYFDKKMLTTGKYFGWFESDKILGVAGIHVFSAEHKIAVLGNIATDPNHRGQGIATKLTSRLVADLLADTDMICLNVKADNESALTCYKKLGFETVLEYEESLFSLK